MVHHKVTGKRYVIADKRRVNVYLTTIWESGLDIRGQRVNCGWTCLMDVKETLLNVKSRDDLSYHPDARRVEGNREGF